jgi:CRP/FNR family cyclic AMP-dependent transcriptional regulator
VTKLSPRTGGDGPPAPMNFASIFRNEPTRQTFAPGDILVREGETNDKMFVILGGELEVRVGGKPVAKLSEGNVFGELSMIDKEPASGDVVALSGGEFVTLDERRFLVVATQNPFFTLELLRLLSAKLRAMNSGPVRE